VKAEGPKEIIMDEKSTWILAWQTINNVSENLPQAHLQEACLTQISADRVSGLAFG